MTWKSRGLTLANQSTEVNSGILFLFFFCKFIMKKIIITCVRSACDFIIRTYFLQRYLERYCSKYFIFVKTFSFSQLFNYSQNSENFHLHRSLAFRGRLLKPMSVATSQCHISYHLGLILRILIGNELHSLSNH